MENQEIKINVEAGVKELIIRHGEAEKVYEPQAVRITGSITAPSKFIAIRKVDPEMGHVTFSRSKMEIVYKETEMADIAPVVTGKLIINPDLEKFHINEQKTFSLKELASFVKMNRLFFSDRDVNAVIVTKLNSFTANVTTDIEKHQDTRGNSKSLQDKKVISNVPVNFILFMPIFVGFDKKTFEVEIAIDSTDVGTKCWLESSDLQELILKERDKIIDGELKHFIDAGLCVIEQY